MRKLIDVKGSLIPDIAKIAATEGIPVKIWIEILIEREVEKITSDYNNDNYFCVNDEDPILCPVAKRFTGCEGCVNLEEKIMTV